MSPTRLAPKQVAEDLIRDRFPTCLASWLTGSAARGGTTETSDIDVVVVLDDNEQSFRETVTASGWLIELFVHTRPSLKIWYLREAAEYRCTLAHMLATGDLLTDAGAAETLQQSARRHVEKGPPARKQPEVDVLRYELSAVVDDLRDSVDRVETTFLAGHAGALAGELLLAVRGSWTGRGKWLARWLHHADPKLAAHLADGMRLAAEADTASLVEVTERILDASGGRLQEGYRLS